MQGKESSIIPQQIFVYVEKKNNNYGRITHVGCSCDDSN